MSMPELPRRTARSVRHTASYASPGKFAQISAAIVAHSSTAAPPVSVLR
jgi:hypothetical protein